MKIAASARPMPLPDRLTRPFWEALARHELSILRCSNCGFYNHPPFPECHRCRSRDLTFEPVSGRGRIYERAIVEAPITPGFENELPYAAVIIELEEQSGLLIAGKFIDADPYGAVVGRAVEAVYEQASDGFVLPGFRLSSSVAGP